MTRKQNPVFKLLSSVIFWGIVTVFVVYTLLPFYWALNTSFKTSAEVRLTPPTAFPEEVTLENYQVALRYDDFIRSVINSFVVCALSTIFALLIGSLAAYALGRYRFYGRTTMRYIILSMNLFPTIAVLPSLLALVRDLELTGTTTSLLITYPIFTIPVTTLRLVVFFQQLPADIEQAAYVDGASPFQMFYRILLPLTMPILLTTGLVVFTSFLSEYLLAFSFTSDNPNARTITVAITFLGDQLGNTGLMAASILVSIPLIIIIFFTQRRFIANTTEGAVKG